MVRMLGIIVGALNASLRQGGGLFFRDRRARFIRRCCWRGIKGSWIQPVEDEVENYDVYEDDYVNDYSVFLL